jgi:hypothetical protein
MSQRVFPLVPPEDPTLIRQSCTPFLGLRIGLDHEDDLLTVGTTGARLEKASTDAGESLSSGQGMDRGEVRVLQAWECPEDQPVETSYWVTLSIPTKPFDGLSLVKGHCFARYAEGTKCVAVRNLSQWRGKVIGLPSLSDLGMEVTLMEGARLVLAQPNSTEICARIKAVEFRGAAGKSIKWWCPGRVDSQDGRKVLYELTFDSPLPADADMVITLYQGIVEEAVPFEVKDMMFVQRAVKPPAPPPDPDF